jgi:hypothetical protein
MEDEQADDASQTLDGAMVEPTRNRRWRADAEMKLS